MAEREEGNLKRRKIMMQWLKDLSEALEALGTNVPIASGGLLGALISLRFLSPTATVLFRITMVFSGFAAAIMTAPIVIYFFEITNVSVMSGASFIVGLYGMAILSEGNELIKNGTLRELFTNIIKRKGGDK